jgi:hypothetical protein
MRQRFGHFIPLAQDTVNQIWDAALLTVDANVLLDLYRYNEQTRSEILRALESFAGRLWISHQAAAEFFRNRSTVIANTDKEFDLADSELKQAAAVVDRIRGNRLVPRELVSTLASGIKPALDQARETLKATREAHPDYLTADPLLEQILTLFDGCVGPEPTGTELESLRKEAERRKSQKIPPGFLDESKNGDKSYGDYFLWAQVLAHAATQDRPVVLVTSERKDDWWEKCKGRRLPRRELLEDAARIAKKPVLLYETDNFLKTLEQRQGRRLAPGIVAEIRAVGSARGHSTVLGVSATVPSPGARAEAEGLIEDALDSLAYNLVDSDEQVTSLIAGTNAAGYTTESIDILEIGVFDFEKARLPFKADIRIAGKQDEDHMFCGDTIIAHIDGFLSFNGDEWEIVDYDVSAELEDYGEGDDDEN